MIEDKIGIQAHWQNDFFYYYFIPQWLSKWCSAQVNPYLSRVLSSKGFFLLLFFVDGFSYRRAVEEFVQRVNLQWLPAAERVFMLFCTVFTLKPGWRVESLWYFVSLRPSTTWLICQHSFSPCSNIPATEYFTHWLQTVHVLPLSLKPSLSTIRVGRVGEGGWGQSVLRSSRWLAFCLRGFVLQERFWI